jgi:hypothetical protein
MTDIFFPYDMTLFKGTPLKFTRSNFGDVMGKDSAYGFINSQFFCSRVMIFLR